MTASAQVLSLADTAIDWAHQARRRRRADLVSVVIPVYENPQLTHECLLTLRGQAAGVDFEAIAVDNGSTEPTRRLLDAWAARWGALKVLRLPENRHFAQGCNLGFAHARGNRVVFLNNDTRVTPNWLAALVSPLKQPRIVAVQPKLLYPDGRVQCAGIVFSADFDIGYPLFCGLPGHLPFVNLARDLQAVTGACMAVRATDFARAQGFDPLFVNGQEDVDLCLRLAKGQPTAHRGTRRVCRYEPASLVYHHEGRSPGRWHHVQPNRLAFVQRWRGHIVPDDRAVHARCGLVITRYLPDHETNIQLGIASGRPVLGEARHS